MTARILPAIYLFAITVIAGVIIGHAVVTAIYYTPALSWVDALAIPLLIGGGIAIRGHFRALEEHNEDEYLETLRKGYSAYVIILIVSVSMISGLATGGIFAIDNADQQKAEDEANEALAEGKHAVKVVKGIEKTATEPVKEIPAIQSFAEIAHTNATTSGLVLKSVIGASNRRTALINNAVLGEGQATSIKAEGIIYQVKCLKIEDRSVILEIEGLTNTVELSL
ncbi:MAG TPA: hypothetical protein VGH19_19750 [Verrucomicrobiae bacterium]